MPQSTQATLIPNRDPQHPFLRASVRYTFRIAILFSLYLGQKTRFRMSQGSQKGGKKETGSATILTVGGPGCPCRPP